MIWHILALLLIVSPVFWLWLIGIEHRAMEQARKEAWKEMEKEEDGHT